MVLAAGKGTQAMSDDIRPYGLGKFNTIIDSVVYEASLGWCDEECGDATTVGWYGFLLFGVDGLQHFMLKHTIGLNGAECEFLRKQAAAIIHEDDQGFVSVEYFEDLDKALINFSSIEKGMEGMVE